MFGFIGADSRPSRTVPLRTCFAHDRLTEFVVYTEVSLLYYSHEPLPPRRAAAAVFFLRQGVKPTERTYLALMEACRRTHDIKAAVGVFEAMETEGVRPGVRSYTSLVEVRAWYFLYCLFFFKIGVPIPSGGPALWSLEQNLDSALKHVSICFQSRGRSGWGGGSQIMSNSAGSNASKQTRG